MGKHERAGTVATVRLAGRPVARRSDRNCVPHDHLLTPPLLTLAALSNTTTSGQPKPHSRRSTAARFSSSRSSATGRTRTSSSRTKKTSQTTTTSLSATSPQKSRTTSSARRSRPLARSATAASCGTPPRARVAGTASWRSGRRPMPSRRSRR